MSAKRYARKWIAAAGLPANDEDVQRLADNIIEVRDEQDVELRYAAQEVKSLIDQSSVNEYLDFLAWKSVMEDAA